MISAELTEVYHAIVDEKGLKGWWTPEALAETPKVGSVSKLSVGGKMTCTLITKALEPDSLVEWECAKQDFHGLSDWIGTTIRFRLKKSKSGTVVDFVQSGWKDKKGLFQECDDGWRHLITKSLKSFVETGKGEPFTPS